jgi:hypothetical protein
MTYKEWAKKHPDKIKKYNKEYRERHKNTIKENQKVYLLKKLYGLSQKDFDKLVALQDGRCAICKRVCDNFVVDHDHTTGKVRGLLCKNCNGLLGFSGDNEQVLASAIKYLNQIKEEDNG